MGRFELYPYQQAVLDSPKPNKFIVWGRQTGKTLTLLRLTQKESLERECFFVAPNYAMTRYTVQLLSGGGHYNRMENTFYPEPIGLPIHFRTYESFERDLSGLHPYPIPFIALDEAELYGGELRGLMSRFDGNSHWAIAGTPHPNKEQERRHWFRREYGIALISPDWDTFVPSTTPPHIPLVTYEQWKHEMSDDAFTTQVLGEWLPDDETQSD